MQSNNTQDRKRGAPDDDGGNQSVKSPKITYKDLADISLKARGLKDSMHGNMFQLNLLMLIFWRAKLLSYSEFGLATEHPEAGNFDDVVFIYRETSQQVRKCRYLQIKHQEPLDGEDLDCVKETQLLSESKKHNDYALYRYYESFLKIKKEINNSESSLHNCQIEDICIVTNKMNKLGNVNFSQEVIHHDPLLGSKIHKQYYTRRKISKKGSFYNDLKKVFNVKKYDMAEYPDFVEKLSIITDYPNRNQVNELLLREMEQHYNVLDGEAKMALYQDEMLKWFAKRKCTFLTPTKYDEFFASLEARIRSYELFGSTNAYFAKTIGRYPFKEDDEVQQKIKGFLESKDYRTLFLKFDKMQLGRPRVSQAFKHIIETSSGSSGEEIGTFIQHFGYIFIDLEQLSDKPFLQNITSELKNTKKGNLVVIDCQPLDHKALRNFLRDVHGAKYSHRKVIIFSEGQLDFDRLNPSSEFKKQYTEEEYTTKLGDLTSDAQKKFRQQCKILFQGKESTVEEVFELEDDDLITSEVLYALMFDKKLEIGATVPASNDHVCYIERTFNDQYRLGESKVVAQNNRINIFCGLSGMGKSEMLTSLSRKLRQTCWVVRVDLNRYSSNFKRIKQERTQGTRGPTLQKGNIKSAVAFLLEIFQPQEPHSQLPNDISRKFFEKVVESKSHRTKIALLIDGFDEICPDYVDIVLDLLLTWNQANAVKIFLTTRLLMEEVLKKGFADDDRKTFYLNRLEWHEERYLLDRIWTHLLNPTDKDIKRFRDFVDFIFGNHKDLVAGIPLHVHLIADAYEDNCRKFLKEKNNARAYRFHRRLNLLKLYKDLVEKKFRIYCKDKAHIDVAFVAAGSILQNFKAHFHERYQMLAAFSLLSPEDFSGLWSVLSISDTTKQEMEAIKSGEDKSGFVDAVWNDVPHFVHQTFAEYFLTEFFVKHLLSGEQPLLFYKILIKFILNSGDRTKFLDIWLNENHGKIKENILSDVRKVALDVLKDNEMVPLWSINSRELLVFIVDASNIVAALENFPIEVKTESTEVFQNLEGILSEANKRRLFAVLDREVQRLICENKTLGHIPRHLVVFTTDLLNKYRNYFSLENWPERELFMEEAAKVCRFYKIAMFLELETTSQRFLESALFSTAGEGNIDAFTHLLKLVDARSLKNPLILCEAVKGRNEQILEIVLESNRDDMKSFLCSQNEECKRAIHMAAFSLRSSICKMIFKEYIKACEKDWKNPEIPVRITDEVIGHIACTLVDLLRIPFSLGPLHNEEIWNNWRMEDIILNLLIYSGFGDIVKMFFEEGFEFYGYPYETSLWLRKRVTDIKYKDTLEILLENIKSRVSVEFYNLLEAGADLTNPSSEARLVIPGAGDSGLVALHYINFHKH